MRANFSDGGKKYCCYKLSGGWKFCKVTYNHPDHSSLFLLQTCSTSSFIDVHVVLKRQFIIIDMSKSQLADLFKKHRELQETEEKLCKWRDVSMLEAYEQDVSNNRSKTVAQLLDSWLNPVFTAPEKVH